MNFSLSLGPLVALIAGILILIIPRLLNYIVALYLIIIGIIGLCTDQVLAFVGRLLFPWESGNNRLARGLKSVARLFAPQKRIAASATTVL